MSSPESYVQPKMTPTKAKGMTVYKRLLKYIKPHWVLLLIGMVATALGSCVDAGLTWSLKPLLNEGFIARDKAFIDMLPFAVVIAFFLRGSTGFVSQYMITRAGRNVVMVLRNQIFEQLLRLPARFFDNNSSGQIVAKLIYNVEMVSQASSNALIIIVRELFFITGILIVMFSISWKLTTLFFATAPFIAIIAKFSSKRMRRFGHYLQNGMGNITHIAEEAVEGYKVIRTYGGENYENNKFTRATRKNRSREMQLIATDALASPAVQMTVSIVIAITVYMATSHASALTAGGFASMLASMLAILKPLKNVTTVNNVIQRGIAGAESIFDVLDEEPELDKGTKEVGRVQGEVEFSDLSFAYPETKKDVLGNINFKAKPGEMIAFVGKSGSGKTTLLSLLPHFYDGYRGKILIDGIDIRELKLKSLRQQFAYVSQHVTLFNDTVAKNIAYAKLENATDEAIHQAADAAYATEFIEQLPEKFETVIGENGYMLSGGQRQRMAIARAIFKDAPILILDEATSALDNESERFVQAALQKLMKGRTTFVIAHRLSTIEQADKIVVLREGRIVEVGNHQELLARGGEYARLHAMQFQFDEVSETSKQDETQTVA